MMRVPKAMDSTSEFDSNKPETTLTYIGGPCRSAGAWDRQACAQGATCPCEPCDYRGASLMAFERLRKRSRDVERGIHAFC